MTIRSTSLAASILVCTLRMAAADLHDPVVPRAGDPLELAALEGPFPSLASYCKQRVREALEDKLSADRCPDRRHTHQLAAPLRSVTLVKLSANSHYPLDYWHIAIETSAGWYVGAAPMCSGRGCTNEPVGIESRPVAGGAPLLIVSFDYQESGHTGSFSGDETTRDLVLCTVGGSGRPACATNAIPARVTADGEDAETHARMAVRLRLDLKPAALRDGKLVFEVSATERVIRGELLEAREWRKRIDALAGAHQLALP